MTLTSTVKLDCVLGTRVWFTVICRWHAFPDGLPVGVGVGVAVAVGVAVGVGVGVGGGRVAVGVGVGVAVGITVAVGVAVAVAVGVGVAVGVAVGVPVGVGVGVPDGHDSPPIVMNVPGEFWLLYSAVIQAAARFVLEIRTSSMLPLNGEDQEELAPIVAKELVAVTGDAAVGPASSDPSLYNLRLDPSNVPTM